MDGGVVLPLEMAQALARGATILTGNQRAARTLRHHFDLHNRRLGLPSWEPPAIFAWDAWTTSLWHRLLIDGHATRLLLNRSQEHDLWRSVIASDTEWTSLRTPDSLAEMAAEAWARLHAWRGESRLRSLGVSADTKAFQRWAFAFERRCRTEGYLSQSQLEATLEAAVAAGQVSLDDGGFALVGFDGMTPSQEALTKALQTAGASVETISLEIDDGPYVLASAEDEAEELSVVARWVRAYLEQHPDARVAVMVPDLDAQRAEIDRVFREVLAPELQDIAAPSDAAPYEFSLGVPLAKTPLVIAALDLLRWSIEPLPIERVSQLLLSPHFAGGGERSARSEFDAYELRRTRMLRPETTLDGMLRAVEGSRRSNRLPRLLGTLKTMRRIIVSEGLATDENRPHADWAEAMRALLKAAGWIGSDNSVEFQTRSKWESTLDELATLDFNGARASFRDALEAVERLAQGTLFAPESRSAPVQVLGPLESAGSTFDAVWFLRAADLTWPIQVASSPLLPWHLQHELRMPGTDATSDSDYARRLTERIAHSSSTVVFSYAKQSADSHQRPSPALNELSLQLVTAQELIPTQSNYSPIALEIVEDRSTLPPVPDQVIRGGAEILKLQAACGFRAFAEKRLWASPLDAAEPGMDARERGNAVHVALEHLWNEVKTQSSLKAMSTAQRQAVLAHCIDIALEKTNAISASAWDEAYMDVQRERLMTLLDQWLMKEREREIPFIVKLSEKNLADAHIGPLRLALRVDRIDETEEGELIIDYKTGEANPKDWLSDRPDEPQLPLYAVLSEAPQLAGVAFAQVRAGKDMELLGYETQAGLLLKPVRLKAATLDDQVDEWRRVLTALATDFHDGDVRVRPKKYPTTCEFCAQRILCRLDPSALEEAADDEQDAEASDG